MFFCDVDCILIRNMPVTPVCFTFAYRFVVDFAALIDGWGFFFFCSAFWNLLPLSQSLEQKNRTSSEKLDPCDRVWWDEIHQCSTCVLICYEFVCITVFLIHGLIGDMNLSDDTGKYRAETSNIWLVMWSQHGSHHEVTCFV